MPGTTPTKPEPTNLADGLDLERASTRSLADDGTVQKSPVEAKVDIEHVPVNDDPRQWSPLRKTTVLLLIAGASMIVGILTAIQNPAVTAMEEDLHTTSSQFSLSLALFLVVQGLVPVAWSGISEIKGRKMVYVCSMALVTGASIGIALSPNIGLVIGFKCIQAAGSSAFLAIGAATLADIYDPHERGTKMGIYYTAPLLGPSIGMVLGGGLTSWLGWRSIFWFCTLFSGTCLVAFVLFFRDTFRKERSSTYQSILKQRLKERAKKSEEVHEKDSRTTVVDGELPDIKITLRDVSPFQPICLVLRRWNNLAMLFVTGIMFSWQMMITYTIARTLSARYHYDAWRIGLVSLAYGMGCLLGSLVGGRLSDLMLRRMRERSEGTSQPEIRLKSTTVGVFLFPTFIVAGGWVTQQHAHIAAVVVMLFGGGFFCVMMYSSILAYIVDANIGRSSSAVATNSVFRGVFAFLGTEVAVPMQDQLGDGWMYTIWAGIVLFSGFLTIWTSFSGANWRRQAEEREGRRPDNITPVYLDTSASDSINT
ncbi:hypothetical protein AN958_07185 [Leucoagaricus sp. SymC.cos]|nr:hypothetical protein AN958_07185 [Leucoagaricus sp. SymC.cos]